MQILEGSMHGNRSFHLLQLASELPGSLNRMSSYPRIPRTTISPVQLDIDDAGYKVVNTSPLMKSRVSIFVGADITRCLRLD